MRCAWEKLLSILPPPIARQLDTRDRQAAREIRLRLGAAPEINLGSTRRELVGAVSQEDLKYTLNLASKYSPWCSATLAQGYLTAPGDTGSGSAGKVFSVRVKPRASGRFVLYVSALPGIFRESGQELRKRPR